MTSVYRLCASSYRSSPFENMVHAQYLVHVSSPSTTNNEGGGWVATGPIGSVSGFVFSSFVEANVTQTRAVNRALVSKDYIFYQTGDRLFRMDYSSLPEVAGYDGFVGNYWTSIHTFTSMEAGRTGRNTGIYSCLLPTQLSGVYKRYIVGLYNSTIAGANTWKGFKHDVDAGTTTETSATDLGFNAPGAQGGVKAEIFWNNRLYFIGTTDGGVGMFDPNTMLLSNNLWPTSDIWGPHDFCPYKGRLFCLNRGENGGGGGSGIYIWNVGNGAPTLAINIGTSGIGVPSHASERFEQRNLLFTDRTYLYAGIISTVDSVTNAYYFHRLLGDENGKFIYHGRVPHVLNANDEVRANFFSEQNTYPDIAGDGDLYSSSSGQLITINWDATGATGCLRQQLAWNGPSSAMTVEESLQGNILHALRETGRSHCKSGGGDRIWTPTSVAGWTGPRADVSDFSYGSAAGRVKIHYHVINNAVDFPAGSPCWIQLRWDNQGTMPFSRGTLFNPSVGALKENDTVVYLAASNSGVTYNFEWDYADSGLTARQNLNIALMVSTTGTP